jgi:hypothetical protein
VGVATCSICGGGPEIVMECTKEKALRHELRKHWLLPDEEKFVYTGPDWLVLLPNALDEEMKGKVLLFWRAWTAWYLRNDLIHGNRMGSIMGSTCFLTSYNESLHVACHGSQVGVDGKGKRPIFPGIQQGKAPSLRDRSNRKSLAKWEPPPSGWVKLNTDAGFCVNFGLDSTGVVVRDSEGKVLLAAWRFLRHCGSPEEAEVEACLQGLADGGASGLLNNQRVLKLIALP